MNQEGIDRYRCKVIGCTKLFKGLDFWRKHVKKRHPEFYYDLVERYGSFADSSAANRVWHNEICIDLIVKYTVRWTSKIDLSGRSWCFVKRDQFEGMLLDPLRVTKAGFSLGLKHRWTENHFWDAGRDDSFFGHSLFEASLVRKMTLNVDYKPSDDRNNPVKFDWAGFDAFFAAHDKLEYLLIELVTHDGDFYRLFGGTRNLFNTNWRAEHEASTCKERFVMKLVIRIRHHVRDSNIGFAAVRTEDVNEDCDFEDAKGDLRGLSDEEAGDRIAHRDLVEYRI